MWWTASPLQHSECGRDTRESMVGQHAESAGCGLLHRVISGKPNRPLHDSPFADHDRVVRLVDRDRALMGTRFGEKLALLGCVVRQGMSPAAHDECGGGGLAGASQHGHECCRDAVTRDRPTNFSGPLDHGHRPLPAVGIDHDAHPPGRSEVESVS
ncbi:unannotated protein [freshwater metagenome]|uniref:Unannotated protein n=1 Tax=freshwater metagenome TaxID=449393 RepID=A0A6J7KQ33_9ZZZZ